MKVYEIQGHFGLDALTVAERPQPQPGPGEVLVRVRAVSLNYRDLLVAKGQYNPKMPLPRVPCSDGAGEVAAVGDGVKGVRAGQRVAGLFMPAWQSGELTEAATRSALGGAVDGMLAEFVVLPESGVIAVPEHLSDEEAATLPCAAVTAWHGLVTEGGVRPGDRVLVQGTGGVSLFALQFAKLAGARVIATSGHDDKLQRVRALGADEGINYKTTPEWGDKARQLAGGDGVDHVVEVGGVGTLAQSLRAVRPGGHISVIGVLTGGGGQVSLFPVLMKKVRLQGIYVGPRSTFAPMNRAIAQHSLKPVVDRVFGFDQAPDAFRHLESGAHFGKVCIRVGG
jgi:NADPH:quinone reductase-like Zn-dependent oxidoreductase